MQYAQASALRVAWGWTKAFLGINAAGVVFAIYLMNRAPLFWSEYWMWAWAPALIGYILLVKLFAWDIRDKNGPERPLLTVSGMIFLPTSILALLFWALLHVSVAYDNRFGDGSFQQEWSEVAPAPANR